MKRPFIAVATGLIALAAAACGLPDDIVGDSPTATTGPNVTPTATEKPPTPAGTETVTPTSTPVVIVFAELEEELNAAQAKWFENGYANYDFTFRWLCFCPPEYGRHALVQVRNGQVTSATDAETGEPHPMAIEEFRTIDGLLYFIREELDGSTEKIEVEFDETTGAPLSATFDRIVQAIDDEIAFEVKDLEWVDVNVQAQEDLDKTRTAWTFAGYAEYSFNFRWNCFCIDDYTQPVTVEVRSGEIVGVTREEGSAVPQEEWDRYETIDGLFGLIQEAIDNDAASIRAEYKVCDPEPEYGAPGGAPSVPENCSGYPVDVFIDHDYRMADEERGFEVSEFARTAPAGG